MGFWANVFGTMGIITPMDETKMTSAELDLLLRSGNQSGSGVSVNLDNALGQTAVKGCCQVISDGIAQVPWKVYSNAADLTEARDHPVFGLLYRRPNGWQTSFEFRETFMFHVLLTGNAFVWKIRVGSERRIVSLEPIEPARVRVKREPDGRIRYWIRADSGAEIEIPAGDMWHIKAPSWNSWMGMDATKLAREAIGLAIGTEASHADLHKNGSRIAGLYSVDGNLTPEQHSKLLQFFEKYAQGGDLAGKPLILDRGAKWSEMQMTGVDAQHLETRKFQIEEICRAFRVMPIMLGVPGAAGAYDNGETMFIAHVVHTLMPWYERLQQSADVNLLSEQDRMQGFYTKLNPNALMRGATKDRSEYFSKALGAGGTPAWMTQDEVRGLEELPPRGGDADILSRGAMNRAPDPATGE